MNDFVYQAQGYLEELSPVETSQRLNETPLPKKSFSIRGKDCSKKCY
jgi:hypothetical protein